MMSSVFDILELGRVVQYRCWIHRTGTQEKEQGGDKGLNTIGM